MGSRPAYPGARAILLDIEGTTTPVDFVYQVLFPYARTEVESFLEAHPDTPELELLRSEYEQDRAQGNGPPDWSPAGYVLWLMDRDRKSTGLKSLQGKIWEKGYRSGELKGTVYPDVPPALARWRKEGKKIGIYSSGSVLAQKLLFTHSTSGDLTPFLDGYFDTTTGAKKDTDSYRKISGALSLPPSDILFLSDVTAELDAARAAGLRTGLCLRDGARAPEGSGHPAIRSFDEVSF